jgi:hypothetical protein
MPEGTPMSDLDADVLNLQSMSNNFDKWETFLGGDLMAQILEVGGTK